MPCSCSPAADSAAIGAACGSAAALPCADSRAGTRSPWDSGRHVSSPAVASPGVSASAEVARPHPTPRLFRILWWSVAFIPVSIGSPIRRAILRGFGAEVGGRTLIGSGVRVAGPGGLVIGSRVTISRGSLADARGGLIIEDAALVGFESILLSWTHRFDDPTTAILEQGFEGCPIRVGRSCWLGARSILLPGVTVGEEAIVGAASVVTRDVRSSVIVAGNPARPIRDRLVGP